MFLSDPWIWNMDGFLEAWIWEKKTDDMPDFGWMNIFGGFKPDVQGLGCAWYMHAVLIYILHFFKAHAYHCISICIHTHTMHIRWMCWVDLPSRTRSKMPSLGGIWGQQMCSKHDLTVKAKVEIDPSADSSSTAFMVEHTKPGGKILVS